MERVYHLHNSYGEFDEYTTDEKKIIMLYIDEVLQCAEYSTMNGCQRDTEKILEEVMILCGKYMKNQIDNNEIDELIEKLNKEHYWLIETKEMI